MDGMELNKYKLNVVIPPFDDFEAMRKAWEEFYAFGNRGHSRSGKQEPGTIVVRGVPSRWFAEPLVSSKPSMLVTHSIFSRLGNISALLVHCWRVKKNKESREKQILQGLLHTTGLRSFTRSAYEEESITGWGPDRSKLFRKTHTCKDGKLVTTKAESKMAQIDELMAQEPPSTQGSLQGTIYWAFNDPYSQGFRQYSRWMTESTELGCYPFQFNFIFAYLNITM
ncbi:hypothetical protein FH972_010280 [Carpinus fangiana]|uniref:Uncharacterized protein n=1 Tax=Carpinus fangiana TaxID=176857 RepID=A0A660KQY3_9ROSI|nr:hypothetical protein FH972_010280 [Carpinus fangiana]